MHPEVAKARATLASRCRHNPNAADDGCRVEARRDLNAAKLLAYIEKTLATAPPLRDDQRAKLAELLKPARA